MGPSLGFVTDVVFLCGAVLHIMVCSIAPLDLFAIVGVQLHYWSCIAPLFLDTIRVSSDQERLYFLIFFAISLFISSLPLHSF